MWLDEADQLFLQALQGYTPSRLADPSWGQPPYGGQRLAPIVNPLGSDHARRQAEIQEAVRVEVARLHAAGHPQQVAPQVSTSREAVGYPPEAVTPRGPASAMQSARKETRQELVNVTREC